MHAGAANEFSSRHHFVFIGTCKHAPNVDAVKWLSASLWPKIRQRVSTDRSECWLQVNASSR